MLKNNIMKSYINLDKSELNRWNRERGDKTHRLSYDLDEDSVVFDVGGYKGDWSSDIFNKYVCNIYIFEPVKKYYNIICDKFSKNKKVHVFNFGLSDAEKEVEIFHSDDSSSVFWGNGESEKIQLKSMIRFMKERDIGHVDLIKINIEGGEYDLLEDVISSGSAKMIDNIQVQYHRFIENCVERRNLIGESFKDTHNITYNFEFIWENWALK